MSAINWEDCIKQSNNKPDLAQTLLDMLSLELPEFKQTIEQAMQQLDRQKLQFSIHKLHGACCYCGANDLKRLLMSLEGRINDLSTDEISHKILKVLDEIARLQQSLNTRDYLPS